MVDFAYIEKNDVVRNLFSKTIYSWQKCRLKACCSSVLELLEILSLNEFPNAILIGLESSTIDDLLRIKVLREQLPLLKIIGVLYSVDKSTVPPIISFETATYLSIEDTEKNFILSFFRLIEKNTEKFEYHTKNYFANDIIINQEKFKELNARISNAEIKILQQIPTGLTYKQIADKLHLSIKTVHNHRENLFRKLHVCSRQELALIAVELGLYKKETL